MIHAEVHGLDELQDALDELVEALDEGAAEGKGEAAAEVAELWREGAPVDTGEYLASIDSDDTSAFATAPHAPYVEFGTSTHPAQPAGSQAAELARTRVPTTIGDAIKRRLP